MVKAAPCAIQDRFFPSRGFYSFDAMWPQEEDAALYWLSRATDVSSDAQMLKLLESRQRLLGLEVSGVQWLRDRQDLLGLSREAWVTLADYAEQSARIPAAVESWLLY